MTEDDILKSLDEYFEPFCRHVGRHFERRKIWRRHAARYSGFDPLLLSLAHCGLWCFRQAPYLVVVVADHFEAYIHIEHESTPKCDRARRMMLPSYRSFVGFQMDLISKFLFEHFDVTIDASLLHNFPHEPKTFVESTLGLKYEPIGSLEGSPVEIDFACRQATVNAFLPLYLHDTNPPESLECYEIDWCTSLDAFLDVYRRWLGIPFVPYVELEKSAVEPEFINGAPAIGISVREVAGDALLIFISNGRSIRLWDGMKYTGSREVAREELKVLETFIGVVIGFRLHWSSRRLYEAYGISLRPGVWPKCKNISLRDWRDVLPKLLGVIPNSCHNGQSREPWDLRQDYVNAWLPIYLHSTTSHLFGACPPEWYYQVHCLANSTEEVRDEGPVNEIFRLATGKQIRPMVDYAMPGISEEFVHQGCPLAIKVEILNSGVFSKKGILYIATSERSCYCHLNAYGFTDVGALMDPGIPKIVADAEYTKRTLAYFGIQIVGPFFEPPANEPHPALLCIPGKNLTANLVLTSMERLLHPEVTSMERSHRKHLTIVKEIRGMKPFLEIYAAAVGAPRPLRIEYSLSCLDGNFLSGQQILGIWSDFEAHADSDAVFTLATVDEARILFPKRRGDSVERMKILESSKVPKVGFWLGRTKELLLKYDVKLGGPLYDLGDDAAAIRALGIDPDDIDLRIPPFEFFAEMHQSWRQAFVNAWVPIFLHRSAPAPWWDRLRALFNSRHQKVD